MTFGDWELFRMVIVSLREMELSSFTYEEGPRSVRFTVGSEQILRKGIFDIFLFICSFFYSTIFWIIFIRYRSCLAK